MGRQAKWVSVEQLLEAYKNGTKSKGSIQTLYFNAIRTNYSERAELYRLTLIEIEKLQKEEKQ
nr:MAG: hypothetical protein [Bacteriophage sp.]